MSPDRLASQVEDAGLNASAPPQQRWLDGWLLRLSPGKAKRARCINALAPGRLPLAERLQGAAAAYRDAGLPLIAARARRSRSRRRSTTTLAGAGLAPLRRHAGDALAVVRCRRTSSMPAPERVDADTYARHRRRLARLAAGAMQRPCGAAARRPGALPGLRPARGRRRSWPAGSSRTKPTWSACTTSSPRPRPAGSGVATALCRWLLRAAASTGARHAYLQVEGDNLPARAVYHRLGFADAYAYHYRTPEAGAV